MTTFKLGNIVFTAGVLDKCVADSDFKRFVSACLIRHIRGDWGNLGEEDIAANERALRFGERLFSSYRSGDWKIYIITEADRSATTVLFPEEY